LLAGVLSFASPKESSQRKGDPGGGAGFAGSLRYSSSRAACQNSPAAQTWQAEGPRPACVAQRLPRGPEKRPRSAYVAQKSGCHGQPEKTPKIEIPSLTPDALPGSLRGAEQRRGWRIKGEDCLRAKPEFRSPRQSRVAQGTGAAGTDPGVAFSLATFFWRSKRKYARQQGGTPSQLDAPFQIKTPHLKHGKQPKTRKTAQKQSLHQVKSHFSESARWSQIVQIVCLDLEGVLVPEIWIEFSKRTGIPELMRTTRDEPDYDKLMNYRLNILREHKLGLPDIQKVIGEMGPMAGARAFLDKLREDYQVVILSDTFYEFAHPLMRQLGWPTLFCHSLEADASGMLVNYHLRMPDQKREAVKRFKELKFKIVAAGDSYNDTAMLGEAHGGILFHPPENVIREFPQFPVVLNYDDLRTEIDKAFAKAA
jgi:phosphoserine/homoserine phosphotransferase